MTTDYLKLADEAAAALKPVRLGSDSMIAPPGLIQRLEQAVRELECKLNTALDNEEFQGDRAHNWMLRFYAANEERDEARAEVERLRTDYEDVHKNTVFAHAEWAKCRAEVDRLWQRIIDLQGGRGSKREEAECPKNESD